MDYPDRPDLRPGAVAVHRMMALRSWAAGKAWRTLPAMPSGRRPVGEQVAHRARFAAEEVAEERVGAREASLSGSQEEPEQEPGHGLRGAVRDLLGHPLLVV